MHILMKQIYIGLFRLQRPPLLSGKFITFGKVLLGMAVNIQLTPLQYGSLITMGILAMFPFAIVSLGNSPNSYFIGLPFWFWIMVTIGGVMYSLSVAFILDPSLRTGTEEEPETISEVN